PAIAQLALELRQGGHLLHAGLAPGRPEIDENDAPPVVGERPALAGLGAEDDVGCGLTHERRGTLARHSSAHGENGERGEKTAGPKPKLAFLPPWSFGADCHRLSSGSRM